MGVIELYRIARNFSGSPAELQSLLKEKCQNVISVGDDLSFVVKLNNEIEIDETLIERLNAKRKRMYPFKNCIVVEKGYVAWDGRFLRISRDIDEKILEKILTSLNIK